MIFVDTNYLLRFLLKDVDSQYKESSDFFTKAVDNKEQVFISQVVVFEILWTLSSFYKSSKNDTVRTLKAILGMKFLEVQNRSVFEKAIDLFTEISLDFPDCFNIAYALEKGATDLKTFDKKCNKIFRKASKATL